MKWIAGLGAGALLLTMSACGGGDEDKAEPSSSPTTSDSPSSSAPAADFADEDPKEIAAAAVEDMKSAESLRMKGDVTKDGQSFTLDVAVTTQGDCKGSIALGEQGTAEILTVGEENWFRPDKQFWNSFAGPEAAKQVLAIVGDKWVVMPPDESGFAELCDLDTFLDALDDPDSTDDVTNKGTDEVDGQEAVILSGESDGDPIKAWIAVDEPHYFLQMAVDSGDEPGRLTFSDFDEDLGIEAPPKDEVVDLNQQG